jgi:hypothetical protein
MMQCEKDLSYLLAEEAKQLQQIIRSRERELRRPAFTKMLEMEVRHFELIVLNIKQAFEHVWQKRLAAQALRNGDMIKALELKHEAQLDDLAVALQVRTRMHHNCSLRLRSADSNAWVPHCIALCVRH